MHRQSVHVCKSTFPQAFPKTLHQPVGGWIRWQGNNEVLCTPWPAFGVDQFPLATITAVQSSWQQLVSAPFCRVFFLFVGSAE